MRTRVTLSCIASAEEAAMTIAAAAAFYDRAGAIASGPGTFTPRIELTPCIKNADQERTR